MSSTVSETPPPLDEARSGLPILKIVIALAALVGLVLLGRQVGGGIPRFAAWVESLGVWGPVVFILGYAVATVAFIPGLLLTLAGGAIFGVAAGTAYVFLGASLGASSAFLVSRYFARGAIEAKLAGYPKFRVIDRAVGRDGFKVVALLRLAPVFPFNLLNYALGLTSVRFWPYAAASLFMLPGSLLYVYSGSIASDAAAAFAEGGGERGTAGWAMLIAGLLATLVLSVFITKKAKQALAEEVEDE